MGKHLSENANNYSRIWMRAVKGFFRIPLCCTGACIYTGRAGAMSLCDSFAAFTSGDIVSAFRFASKSHSHYVRSAEFLAEAEHGKWAGYYKGDCLTDVRLTAMCLNALVSYLRILGDGPDFHKWERDFLTPAAEQKVALLSSKQRAMTNEELVGNMAVADIPKKSRTYPGKSSRRGVLSFGQPRTRSCHS